MFYSGFVWLAVDGLTFKLNESHDTYQVQVSKLYNEHVLLHTKRYLCAGMQCVCVCVCH